MKAIVDVGHAANHKVAIHSYGPSGVKDAVRAGADSVEHGIDLDDETIAAILTYVRRSWGHASSPVTREQVRIVRGQVERRHEPWTEAELEPMN